jgi:hypothetical protein
MMKRCTSILLIAVVAVLAGCASPARIDQMTISPDALKTAPNDSPLKQAIGIKSVTGGKDTNPMWVSNISSSDFERALESSLRAAGFLSPVRSAGRFQLTADLIRVDQPMFGFDMTVSATVRYSIVEQATGKEIFSRNIPTSFTATVSNAFVGAERLKLANEGAVRNNFAALIDELTRLGIQVSLK